MSEPDVLKPSKPDDIHLCEAVAHRILELQGLTVRLTGMDLVIPEELRRDQVRYMRMIGRFQDGDFRHTPSEMQSLKTIAQWTVDLNCMLRGQEPKIVQWAQ